MTISTSLPSSASIVSCRDRLWVVMPQANSELMQLRPIGGSEDQICAVYQLLKELDPITSAEFPLPNPDTIGDRTSFQLLLDAARLNLRAGASPFRCLGKLSVYPRPYQLVPLLMALRLPTVRMLIADDVGIGKTVEAGLIARELLDRQEIHRTVVLCPPQLCQQWQKELKQKFQIDAVVVRSSTAAKLERGLPSGKHIFEYYPHIIVSLDYVKSDRHRVSFMAHCPDFVIVDEAHTCSNSSADGSAQQQRYRLIEEIARQEKRHLVLLSATPHSGIETGFLSLISLLKPEFGKIDLSNFALSERAELAKYFVQRRRGDIKQWLGAETPFPDRDSTEVSYQLSKPYQQLYSEVYDFARNLVKTTDGLSKAKQQGRYWSALAILRCVMSSPAAAIATLGKQIENRTLAGIEEIDDELMSTYIYDRTEQEQCSDATPPIEMQAQEGERRKLRQFLKDAGAISPKDDRKLQTTIAWVKARLDEGLNPIVWCRYLATAKYVSEQLTQELTKKKSSQVRIIAITGEQSEDEREERLAELATYPQRVMVATDCLSEGVNLQNHFQAAIHYDLPWNPNRLEQREGRIDRYGQAAPVVKTCLLYGSDNKIDLAVLDVLIRKAVSIRKTLGITVPLPIDSSTIQTAIFKSLFEQPSSVQQLSLDLFQAGSPVAEVHSRWDKAVDREKQSRTKFAQQSIKPGEIDTELQAANRILGSSEDVERFVRTACERLGNSLKREKKYWVMATPPQCLKSIVEKIVGDKPLQMTFQSSPIDGVEYIGRNHPIVERLASFLLEETLTDKQNPTAARCGYVITDRVKVRTNLLLLRLRHLIGDLDAGGISTPPLMAEECIVAGFTGAPSNPQWLSPEAALELLQSAEATANATDGQKQREVKDLLDRYPELSPDLEILARERAEELGDTYARIRAITKGKRSIVHPQMPMDLLGLLILTPG
ncbi:helicase-related protein [Chamaesiphon minutus]|uniref:DNA/RNA helicase, superfamily II, SNF2 family n=1 Tax=Chamaesiphon minutus (strain ATCC 27169 / PCC 6605) TaxID=1173020 RepID=K9UPW4_CHAP6|nr:helicase-related protein [Chamaesiphon minutus]AFY96840.1 DNA/RNA helicase, superfamily II, SNF2 family [Chamaesiphon minutus PCC 6605]